MLYYIGRVFGVFLNITLPHSPKCPHKGLIYNCNLSKKWSVFFFSLSGLTLFFIFSPILFQLHFIHVSTYRTVTTSNLNLTSSFFFLNLWLVMASAFHLLNLQTLEDFPNWLFTRIPKWRLEKPREVLVVFTELVQGPCWTLRSVQK